MDTSVFSNVRAASLLSLALSGCEGSGVDGTESPAGDDTPPEVVSASPTDGASGVDGDVVLSITFSEPMDPIATGAAYASESAGLRPDEVVLSWSTDGTTLSVTPLAPLPYAEGSSAASTAALSYAFTIGTGARDTAGNALASEHTVTFTTWRSISEALTCGSSGSVGPDGTQANPELIAGSPDGSVPVVAYLGYTLPDVVPGTLLATMHLVVTGEFGTPYVQYAFTDYGVSVTDQLDRIDATTPLDGVLAAESEFTVVRSLFVADGQRSIAVDVTDALTGVWSTPSAALLFRIQFPGMQEAKFGSWAEYSPCTSGGQTRLNLEYLVP